jgi:hypothetical protein
MLLVHTKYKHSFGTVLVFELLYIGTDVCYNRFSPDKLSVVSYFVKIL